MGAFTYESEATSTISPGKLFKALVLDADTLLPKVLPQAIKNIQILEGDGGAGTIKLTTFVEGSQHKSIKLRVDELDREKLVYKYTVLEGILGDVVESVTATVTVEASSDGGSVVKNSSTYHAKGDAKLDQEQLKSAKERSSSILKAIEAYLIANPDYN